MSASRSETMALVWSALVPGVIFAIGLALAGMTRPDKVIGFLDLGPGWDPSLGFVMVGAIGVNALVYRWSQRLSAPFFAPRFSLPTRTDLDGRLIGGAALFGIGWALGGFCPGPALVSAAGGGGWALLFVPAMLAGIALFQKVDRWRPNPPLSSTHHVPGEHPFLAPSVLAQIPHPPGEPPTRTH